MRKEPTGFPAEFRSDVVATAKKPLKAGDTLDGEGGYAVYGKLMRAEDSLARRALPLGLAHGIKLMRPVAQGAAVSWDDVAIEENDVVRLRREMERAFAPKSAVKGARKPRSGMKLRAKLFAGVLALLAALVPAAPQADEAALAALKAGGHVMIVRHGLTTPGFGDPLGFQIEDCATQRNLVEQGREQARTARQAPARARDRRSSACSPRNGAVRRKPRALIDVGPVETLAISNNLYGRPALREAQTRELARRDCGLEGQGHAPHRQPRLGDFFAQPARTRARRKASC